MPDISNFFCIGLLNRGNYIREAILNLMRNAIEAMPEGGNLTIRLKARSSAEEQSGTSEDGQIFIQVGILA